MSRPRRSSTESTQVPPTKFGGLKGSMRKGFKSIRKTLRKKETVEPRTYTELTHGPPPARILEQQDCGASGILAEPAPTPIERPPPPPRMRIRNTKRSPSGDVSHDEISLVKPVRRFKIKRPTAVEHDSYREELPTPPPSKPHSFRSEQRRVGSAVEVESTFGTVKQQEQEDETADHTAAAEPEVEAQDKVEKALPSGNGKEESTGYSIAEFNDRVQTLKARMSTIKATLDREAINDEYDPALDARGSRILEHVVSLQAEASEACDSRYVLSEEEIASIDNEYHSSNAESTARMLAVEEEGERLVAEAQALAQSEEEATKPPPNAPKAPRAMLERQAQRAAVAHARQSQPQSWGRNGRPSYNQRQVNSGGYRSANSRPNQRRPYHSQSMPRGGFRNTAPQYYNLQSNPQSYPRGGAPSMPPFQPNCYETWTMPRGMPLESMGPPPMSWGFMSPDYTGHMV